MWGYAGCTAKRSMVRFPSGSSIIFTKNFPFFLRPDSYDVNSEESISLRFIHSGILLFIHSFSYIHSKSHRFLRIVNSVTSTPRKKRMFCLKVLRSRVGIEPTTSRLNTERRLTTPPFLTFELYIIWHIFELTVQMLFYC